VLDDDDDDDDDDAPPGASTVRGAYGLPDRRRAAIARSTDAKKDPAQQMLVGRSPPCSTAGCPWAGASA
jgi:hypothetical protein